MAAFEQAPHRLRTDSIFFPAMAMAMAGIVFVGFAPTYYLKYQFSGPDLSILKMVHGAAFTGWIVLLIVQTGLVASNRRTLHRKLGVIGAFLAASMVVLASLLAVDALRQGFTPPGGPPAFQFFAVPVGDIVGFVVLVGIGIAARKRLDYHKRYMLLGTALILDAAVARIRLDVVQQAPLPISFIVADLFVVAMAGYDLATRRRVHPATMISAAIILVSQVGRILISSTAWWHAFANALL